MYEYEHSSSEWKVTIYTKNKKNRIIPEFQFLSFINMKTADILYSSFSNLMNRI